MYSIQTTDYDGNNSIEVTIDYLQREDIRVYFDDVQVYPIDGKWHWVSGTESRIIIDDPSIAIGTVIKFQRWTELGMVHNDFSAGARFTAPNLDENFNQLLYLAQEMIEYGGGGGGGGGYGVNSFNGRYGDVELLQSDIIALGFTPGGGGGTAGVSSFNGRTGAVTLTSADVPATLISTIKSGTGAVPVTLDARVKRMYLTPEDFGAAGNAGPGGTGTDDTAAFQRMFAACPRGAVCMARGRYLIDGNLDIPSNITLRGDFTRTGNSSGNYFAPYDELQSTIYLNQARSLHMKGGSTIDGMLIIRKGQPVPAVTAAGFAGLAVVCDQDDTTVTNSMILGFDRAVYSYGVQRTECSNLKIDCNNGIEMSLAVDVCYARQVHCWPFLTAGGGGTTLEGGQRIGTAFQFHNISDWTKVSDCFSWGYYRGTIVDSCDNMTLLNVGHDGPIGNIGTIGFLITGNSQGTRIIGGQCAAQDQGVVINTTPGKFTEIQNTDTWSTTDNGVLVSSGDCNITGGFHRIVNHGINVNSVTSRVNISGVRFSEHAGAPIAVVAGNSTTFIHNNDYGDWTGAVLPDTGATTGATASAVSFVPHGYVTATNVQGALNTIIDGAGGSVVPSTTTPQATATSGNVGVSTKYAREDHVHQGLASGTFFTPYSIIGSSNVQNAIQDLVDLKAQKNGNNSEFFQMQTLAVDNNTDTGATTKWYFNQTATAAPAGIGTPAVGTSTLWAKADHVHSAAASAVVNTPSGAVTATDVQGAINQLALMSGGAAPATATPSTVALTAAVGTATKYAREDHVHRGLASGTFFTPYGIIGSSNVQNAIQDLVDLKAPINGNGSQFFQVQTVPVDNNTTAAASTAWYFGQASTSNALAGGTASPGTSTKWARADHVHPSQAVPIASSTAPAAIGSAAVGSSATYARSDHVHNASASAVFFNPFGTIGSSNVQNAIQDLVSLKAELNGNGSQFFQASSFTGGWGSFSNSGAPSTRSAVEATSSASTSGSNAAIKATAGNTSTAAIIVDGRLNSVAKTGGTGNWATNGVAPLSNNTYDLGAPSFAYQSIYSVNAVTVTSDRRTKTGIRELSEGMSFLRKLKPVTYLRKVDRNEVQEDGSLKELPGDKLHMGFIAQDVKEAIGDVKMALWSLADAADPDSVQALQREELIAPIVRALQELDARVKQLEK